MVEQEKWKWQEPGTTWKGAGLYHVTLTIPDRRPLLGSLEVPDNDPAYWHQGRGEGVLAGHEENRAGLLSGCFDCPFFGYPGDINHMLQMGYGTTDDAYLISPELPDYPSGCVLKFNYFTAGSTSTFQVGYSTTTDVLSAFTWSDDAFDIDTPDNDDIFYMTANNQLVKAKT